LCAILNWTSTNPNEPECHLAPIAAWTDRVCCLPQYRWTGSLHYVEGKDDYPSETCAFPGNSGWVNGPVNLLNGIVNTTRILEEWDGRAEEVGSVMNEALKFLVHFYGDLHMPLRAAGRARGGNGIKVMFDGRHTNLHSLWDGLLIAQRLRTLSSNYTLPLLIPEIEFNLRGAIYDPYVRRVMWEGIMGRWKGEVQQWLLCPSPEPAFPAAGNGGMLQTVMGMFRRNRNPINVMNCDFIFPKALDERPYRARYHDADHLGHDRCSKTEHEDEARAADVPYLELDTPEYAGRIKDEFVIEKLIVQGGFGSRGAGGFCGQLWVPGV
ncbi:phospholipase C/P1 nuclease, partial [Athelia psychrophila]